MATRRTHISLPAELVAKIDKLVGVRGRSAFLTETAQKEVHKRNLLAYLKSGVPIMKDEDHPDIVALGTAEWVRRMRGHTDGVPKPEHPAWPKVKAKARSVRA